MKILAIETSTRNLGIAIADEDSILAEYKGIAELKHSQDLVPNIERLLKKSRLSLRDIDCLAISIGPGSFTGLRVGVSILKGLNMVTKIPIVTIPTLDAIAYNAVDKKRPICVVVDAKKNNLYTSLYKPEAGGIIRLWDYVLITPDELLKKIDGETLFLGDGIKPYRRLIKEILKSARLADMKYWFPDVKIVARLGMAKFKNKELQDPDTLVPMYIYSSECNVNKAQTYGTK